MAGIHHGDDFVSAFRRFTAGFGQFGVGDDLSIVCQQALDTGLRRGIPVARAMTGKVDETFAAAARFAAHFAQGPKDVVLGSFLVAYKPDVCSRDTHGFCDALRTVHVVRHTFKRRRLS